MGKKGKWFAAIKRVFTTHSKDKLVNEPEKKGSKEKKKKGRGTSFIPLFREPSSIEQILGDAEREHKLSFRPPTPPEQPKTPPFVLPRAPSPRGPTPRAASPKVASPRAVARVPSPPRASSPKASPPRAVSPRIIQHRKEIKYRPEPNLRNQHASATKIQAAYRGYMARRSFRALRGLVRLQGVIRGQSVKRQTTNAMKYMQLLVRVQSQIQLRRIQMLENQARHQSPYKNDKDVESAFGKWSSASEAGNHGEWDDSLLTKEEIEARLQRKVDAVVKRERAMAYAYSHRPWKNAPKSADVRSGGYPLWLNWLERQLPSTTPENHALRNFHLTPPRPYSELIPSTRPQSSNQKQPHIGLDSMDALTPTSSKSSMIASTKPSRPPLSSRTPQANTRYSRARASGAASPFDLPLKDDDSLTSCPPFSVPSYMTPTVSAKAKVRANSNPKERAPGTPGSESKRRSSFPLAQGFGSFKWNKGSLFSGKGSGSARMIDKSQPLHSVGNLSMDSTVSLPVGVGRKPFNRFV